MTCLKSLTIKNFRGFDSLEIEGFSRINLFLGKNNSGKSSVLESLFLLMGMSNPMLPNRLNQIRDLNVSSAKQLKYLFHKLKFDNVPFFQGHFDDASERSLRIEARYQQGMLSKDIPDINASTIAPEIAGLDLVFSAKKENEEETSKSSLLFENEKINQTISQDYTEKLYALFIPPYTKDSGTSERYSEIVKRKEGDSILRSLQAFDERIINIQLLTDGMYFDIKDVDELVPSNILGDGIRRFLSIITAVSENKKSFICIDEIENGLHYSAYKLLWRSIIFYVAKNPDIQLFISTHNVEVLSCLKLVLEEENGMNMQDFTKVFTIDQTRNAGFKAYRYSFEGFKDAIEQEIELRS